jgi:hypothetical protein
MDGDKEKYVFRLVIDCLLIFVMIAASGYASMNFKTLLAKPSGMYLVPVLIILLIEFYAFVIFSCVKDAHIIGALSKNNVGVLTIEKTQTKIGEMLVDVVEFLQSDNEAISAEVSATVALIQTEVAALDTRLLSINTQKRTVMLGLLALCFVCALVFLLVQKKIPEVWVKIVGYSTVAIVSVASLFGFVEDIVNRRESMMTEAIENFGKVDSGNKAALTKATNALILHVPGITPSIADSVGVILLSSVIMVVSIAGAVLLYRMDAESEVTMDLLETVVAYFAVVCLILTLCFYYNRLQNAIT